MNELLLTKEEVVDLLNKDDAEIAEHINSIAHPADISEFFRHIPVKEWPRLLNLISDDEVRAAVVFDFERSEWLQLLPLLSPEEIAKIINKLETDDAADLLADIPLPERLDALRLLSQKDRHQVQQLLRYPEDSAGGIMQLELALVSEDKTVQDAINIVRQLVEEDVEVLSVLVVDHNRRLVGALALVDLLLNKATTKVASIMDKDLVFVKPLLDQEKVAAIFKKYDLLSIPVVDDSGRVLGRIVVDDVVDVLTEEAEEDALHMAGTSTEELLHEGAVFATARVRLPWLGVALCCSLVNGFLLNYFEPIMAQALIIFSLIPVVTAMGGNVGTQSATILIRGFATGKFELSDVSKFLFKEVRVGMLMGIVCGSFAALVSTFLLSHANFYLGLVVFLAMVAGMMTATVLGVIAPSLLKRLNFDPAIASGPFVTSLNDIAGIVIYMLIASAFITHLQIG